MSEMIDSTDPSNDMLLADNAGISDEDREDILREIDKVVDENKIEVTGELFRIGQAKKGVFLPLFINFLAAGIIVGGFFFATWYFEQKKETLSLQAETFLSAEGRLIAELKREAEARLAAKDGEIGEIQSQLAEIEQERADLVQTMDSQIQAREQELKDALDRQLALEKSRLEALGRSEADISKQLQDLEAKVTAEQSQELNAFKAQAEAAIQEKEAELVQNRALTEQILAEAQTERADLEERSQAREAEIVAQYEEEKAALAERTTEVEQQLQDITVFQAQEKLVSDQIVGTYALIQQKIASGQFLDAKGDVEQLRTLLYDSSIESLPNVSARRDADLFILDSLEELVEARASLEETKTSDSILETANLLNNARGAVARADTAYQDGGLEEAKRLYLDALTLVPSFSRAYANLRTIEVSEGKDILETALSSANTLFQSGNVAGAVQAYSDAIVESAGGNTTLVTQAVAGISDTLESAIISLRSQLGAAQTRAATLEAANTDARASIDRLSRELSVEADRASELSGRLSTALTDVSSLTERLLSAETQVENLEETLSGSETELADLRSSATEAEVVNDRITGVNQEYKSEIEALSETLSERTEELANLAEDLARNVATTSELQTTLADRDAAIAALQAANTELTGTLATTETGSTTLQDQVNAANAKIAELESAAVLSEESLSAEIEKVASASARIEDLEGRLQSATSAAEDLQADLAEQAAQLSDAIAEGNTLQADLDGAGGRISGLESDLASEKEKNRVLQAQAEAQAEAESGTAGDLDAELAEANKTIRSLTEQIEQLEESGATEQVTDIELEQLRAAYQGYFGTIEKLMASGSEADVRTAKETLSVFFERVNDRAFPGMYAVWSQVDSEFITLEQELYEENARKNSLNEIIRYVDYLEAGDEASMAAKIAFEALAQRDLLYKRAFNGIQEIAGSGITDVTVQTEFVQIGTVDTILAGGVTVATETAADIGNTALVKRIDENGTESTVAQGVVSSVEDGSVTVEIQRYLDPTTPRPGDIVYLETEIR